MLGTDQNNLYSKHTVLLSEAKSSNKKRDDKKGTTNRTIDSGGSARLTHSHQRGSPGSGGSQT